MCRIKNAILINAKFLQEECPTVERQQIGPSINFEDLLPIRFKGKKMAT